MQFRFLLDAACYIKRSFRKQPIARLQQEFVKVKEKKNHVQVTYLVFAKLFREGLSPNKDPSLNFQLNRIIGF